MVVWTQVSASKSLGCGSRKGMGVPECCVSSDVKSRNIAAHTGSMPLGQDARVDLSTAFHPGSSGHHCGIGTGRNTRQTAEPIVGTCFSNTFEQYHTEMVGNQKGGNLGCWIWARDVRMNDRGVGVALQQADALLFPLEGRG